MISPIVYACDHVLAGDRSIEIVVHHADDEWQMTCGKRDHSEDGASIRPINAEHLFEDNPFLEHLMKSLDRGWLAEWTDGHWEMLAHDD